MQKSNSADKKGNKTACAAVDLYWCWLNNFVVDYGGVSSSELVGSDGGGPTTTVDKA